MKRMAALIILLFMGVILMSMQNAKPVRVVFFGDSITELGVQPGGYIDRMRNTLKEKNATNFQLIGAGISGNKVYDLFLRLEDDVLRQQPD